MLKKKKKKGDLRKDFEKLTRLHELQLGHKMALSGYYKKTAKTKPAKNRERISGIIIIWETDKII